MSAKSAVYNNDIFNYDQLRLIEKPDSPKNAGQLPQSLEGCKGYLTKLVLLPPNVNQNIPSTVASMVNILTLPEASPQLAAAAESEAAAAAGARLEGQPAAVYNPSTNVMKALLKKAHARACHVGAPGVMGHVVFPGCLSFYKLDGKTFAAPPGRWWLASVKAKWFAKNVELNVDEIKSNASTILILRIPPGSLGRIRDQGVEHLLDVGTHVFNSGTVSNEGTVQYSRANHIPHGRYNYVRVPRGKFARVWAEVFDSGGSRRGETKSVQPRLLYEGEHCIDSHLFQYVGMSNVSDEYIAHGSIHRISVQKGFVGKVWQDNIPRLLGEGDHVIESTAFSFEGTESILSNHCIVHGTITIMRVTLGQIALVWQDNEPTFFDKPGLLEFDSPDFSFVEFKDAEEQLIQLGAKKIVLVHTGQVGVTYDKGRLSIMYSGRHIINSATHIFHRFLSTQQRSIRLATLNAGEKLARQSGSGRMSSREYYSSKSMTKQQVSTNKEKRFEEAKKDKRHASISTVDRDADLTVCETKDLVKVGMRADVFYSIEDPEKCIQKIDTDDLEDLVRETAVATLTNIIRSTALNEIAQSKSVSVRTMNGGIHVLAPPNVNNSNPPPTAPAAVFFEKVHDEFLSKLNEDFMERYGVDIANIRIESFKIMDEELADQISKHALTTAQIENEMANLEGKSLISTTQERTAAEVKNISAEAAAISEKTIADAENKRKVDAALASAESHKIAAHAKAEAEADAILTKARAEAEAIRLKATAEAERAELLSRTKLGQQEALLSQYAHMVVESNRGVEKVVYLDPSVNRESPFALGSLQNLNNDLHSLTRLGIASNQANGGNGES
eukprot:CAMPEP_0119029572 /NCGR_PEP_ID=MMETSP1176-20130426/40581_1 /TAXON_ID=265551 /ORGANISM="Synedropsis recta cf, Strain CCMP1620" /LENGTH=842 /DNA_ID=CAMNT_0006985919 /DNA_START=110 /DNA_END=2638 /DNA_ORIENTATION=+